MRGHGMGTDHQKANVGVAESGKQVEEVVVHPRPSASLAGLRMMRTGISRRE